jgi:hypothetical protein
MSSNQSITANFSTSTVSETITTSPTGLSVTVDGIAYTSPQTFSWQPGSSHTISTTTPQSANGTQPSPQQFQFANWSDNGTISHTISASASTDTATFATIAGPSWLQANLSFMSFGYYDTSHASSTNFSQSCPAGSTVRGCFQTVLQNLRAQGVSGVRIFVPLCEGDGNISPINSYVNGVWTGCTQTPNVSFDSSTGPGYTWVQNAGNFFSDLNSAGIQNVTITIAHGSPAGAPTNADGSWGFQVPLASTTQPGPSVCQSGVSDPIDFWPGLPYGLSYNVTQKTYDIPGHDEPASQGYNCAPINPYFIGWTNQFNAIDALLGAAQGKVTVYELEFEQELNLVDFTAELRFIYDNAQVSTYNGAYSGCSTNYVDMVCVLGTLMSNHHFDPGRVTWSAPYIDASVATNDQYGNCLDIYQDYARQFNLGGIASAFGGGYIGHPDDATAVNNLWCGGSGTTTMLKVPLAHSQPNIVDVHLYPHVEGAGPGDTQVQQVAALDFSDLTHFLGLIYPSGPTPMVMIGETHVGTLLPNGTAKDGSPCPANNYPQYAAASAVAGFNQSQLAGYSIVFRPWMELQDDQGTCYPYPAYQNVNFGGGGPYAPTQH